MLLIIYLSRVWDFKAIILDKCKWSEEFSETINLSFVLYEFWLAKMCCSLLPVCWPRMSIVSTLSAARCMNGNYLSSSAFRNRRGPIPSGFIWNCRSYRQSVGLLGRGISPVARPLHERNVRTEEKRTFICESLPWDTPTGYEYQIATEVTLTQIGIEATARLGRTTTFVTPTKKWNQQTPRNLRKYLEWLYDSHHSGPNGQRYGSSKLTRQFNLAGISDERTKFHHITSQLEQRYAAEVEDIIISPPHHEPCTKLRTEILKRLAPSEQQRSHQLLTLEDMVDRKRSQFLRHLRSLAPDMPDLHMRTIWFSLLPTKIQTCLCAANPSPCLPTGWSLLKYWMRTTANTLSQNLLTPQHQPNHLLTYQHRLQRSRLHALSDMSIFLYASPPKHQSPRGDDVGAFHGILPQVTKSLPR
jgi:hypothetical protein